MPIVKMQLNYLIDPRDRDEPALQDKIFHGTVALTWREYRTLKRMHTNGRYLCVTMEVE